MCIYCIYIYPRIFLRDVAEFYTKDYPISSLWSNLKDIPNIYRSIFVHAGVFTYSTGITGLKKCAKKIYRLAFHAKYRCCEWTPASVSLKPICLLLCPLEPDHKRSYNSFSLLFSYSSSHFTLRQANRTLPKISLLFYTGALFYIIS